jgi:hypothetical protein
MSLLCIPNYGPDHSATAVLAIVRKIMGEGIHQSYDNEKSDYLALPQVAEWYNGRECGYIIHMRSRNFARQINIAFFEHRNSDSLCAIRWEQTSMNPLTIETMDKDCCFYKNKYDVSKSVAYNEQYKLAKWIVDELCGFWVLSDANVGARS